MLQYDAGYWTTWQIWNRLGTRLDVLGDLALRTRSPFVLDALALACSAGRSDAIRLMREVLDGSHLKLSTPAAAALGRVWGGLGRSAADVQSAAEIYRGLAASGELARLDAVHQQCAAQAMFLAGLHRELTETLPDLHRIPDVVRRHLEIDLANPYLRRDPAPTEHDRWVELLARPFSEFGLDGPAVRRPVDGSAIPLFDHLRAPTRPQDDVSGALVSVIVPCYRPDEGLMTSLESLLGQTWGDLEIIVVDDASGPGYSDLFQRAEALDDRIEVVTMETNGGSYLARNRALAKVRGEFVTFQDADDWSHPRRVELQVKDLLDNPESPANHSRAIRARDDLTHQWFGYPPVRSNASSLMLRHQVIDRVGVFAPVRKGGDSEYAERMAVLAGKPRELLQPLAVTRLRAGTLSRGDFTYSWAAPDRLAFRGGYRAWHRRLSVTGAASPPDLRFPWPPGYAAIAGTAETELGLLGDFSGDPEKEGGVIGLLWHRLTADPEARGVRGIALWHAEGLLSERRNRPEMHPRWYDLAASDVIETPITRTQSRRVGRLLVQNPYSLLLLKDQDVSVAVDRVEVLLTPQVVEPDSSGLPTDLLAVRDAAAALWDTAPAWVAAREGLGEDDFHMLDEALPGLVLDRWDPAAWVSGDYPTDRITSR